MSNPGTETDSGGTATPDAIVAGLAARAAKKVGA